MKPYLLPRGDLLNTRAARDLILEVGGSLLNTAPLGVGLVVSLPDGNDDLIELCGLIPWY